MGIEFHFLNVGDGDCTIIHFPERKRHDGKIKDERIMVVDINQHKDDPDYENVIEYYKENFPDNNGSYKSIFRFVCSHPHQDHICGLSQLFSEEGIKIINFWDLLHLFKPEDFEGHPTHEDDWKTYEYLGGKDSPVTIIRTMREDNPGQFWNDDEDRISILSPCKELIKYAHYKDDGTRRTDSDVLIDEMCYCLMIKINDKKVILSGDGRETPFWQNIYENCKPELKDCTVLKAGHHGHECSVHNDAVKLMRPQIVVFSDSKSEDEANGASDHYKKLVPETEIYKTWESGTIIINIPFASSENIEIRTTK